MTVAAVVASQSISNMCLDLVMLAGVKYTQGYTTLVVTGLVPIIASLKTAASPSLPRELRMLVMPAVQLTFLSASGGMQSILLPPKLLPHGQAAHQQQSKGKVWPR